MLFNSLHFALFFPIVFALYWGLPHKFRVWLLLIASYYFYMSWNAKYVVLILFTTLVSYFAALLLERTHSQRTKRLILAGSLVACLGVLFVFKYFNFFAGVLVDFMDVFAIKLHPTTLKLLLPVGISFYTFQTLGYVIDVYRGTTKAEHNLGVYATFISFFPQLVAGPIERTNNLLPQIKAVHTFNYSQAVEGGKLMAWGFFKKLAVADILAVYVDKVYGDVYSYRGLALACAAGFFTVQIYCDFSGYSDIARGCSKMLGIDLMENFRCPYFSASIHEFWSRWHISLSTWFRDYVYIPLGGNRVSKWRHNINLMLTFIISGLWHGASWTFVVWGAVHGLAQVIENVCISRKSEPHGLMWFVRVLGTFVFVTLAWIFFRAGSIDEAVHVFANLFSPRIRYLSVDRFVVIPPMLLAACEFLAVLRGCTPIELLSRKNVFVRWSAYLAVGFMIVFLSPKGIANDFVYFQF